MIARIALALLITLPLLAQAEEKPAKATITGNVEFTGEAKFAAETVATVQLLDVSLQDVAAVTIAKQTITDLKKFPIPFEVEYDPAKIMPGHEYAIQVRIETKGKLNYINDTRITVITRNAATKNVKAPVIAVK